VEKILDSTLFLGRVEYRVYTLEGYGVEEDEWDQSRDVQGQNASLPPFNRDPPGGTATMDPRSKNKLASITLSNIMRAYLPVI